MAQIPLGPISFDRVVEAVEAVQRRLHRATAALETSGIPYAVIGGNAVAVWVARVDQAAVRNTQDVDIMIRRADFAQATAVLEKAGFRRRRIMGIEMFLDGPRGRPRDGVHVLFAGEKVRAEYAVPAPEISEIEQGPKFRLLTLEALVRMKLTSFRDKDRMHLRDLCGVSLVDATWPPRFPPELAVRLQEILDTPDG
jgi:hypothetical protein